MRSRSRLLIASVSAAAAAATGSVCSTSTCIGHFRGGAASRVELPPSGANTSPTITAAKSTGTRRKKRRSTRKRSSSYLQSTIPEGGDNAKSEPVNHILTSRKQSPSSPPEASETPKSSTQTVESCVAPFMASATPWVRRYLEQSPTDVLLPVPREFLSDGFNLQGLQQVVEKAGEAAAQEEVGSDVDNTLSDQKDGAGVKAVPSFPLYRAALRLILSKDEEMIMNQANDNEINAAAIALYTLVHARFSVSPRGIDTLRRILRRSTSEPVEPVFGRCPRMGCNGMALLPVGISDEYNVGKAMRYCCSCGEIFHRFDSKVDGSAWGTSLCHLFLMTHGSIFPEFEVSRSCNTVHTRTTSCDEITDIDSSPPIGGMRPLPQIFGFPVHETHARIKYPLLKQRQVVT